MSLNFFASCLFAIAFSLSGSFQDRSDRIVWDDDLSLTWDDFQAHPPGRSPRSATTVSGMEIVWDVDKKVLRVTAYAYFDKRESWVKKESKNEHLLEHEQGHFSITEIFCRKFKQQLLEERIRPRNAGKKINEVYRQTDERLDAFQAEYDQETQYGKDYNVQAKWNEKIAAELESLRGYADKELRINL